jgi:hypothetical protein
MAGDGFDDNGVEQFINGAETTAALSGIAEEIRDASQTAAVEMASRILESFNVDVDIDDYLGSDLSKTIMKYQSFAESTRPLGGEIPQDIIDQRDEAIRRAIIAERRSGSSGVDLYISDYLAETYDVENQCFPAHTAVLTSLTSSTAISALRVGDIVLSYDQHAKKMVAVR